MPGYYVGTYGVIAMPKVARPGKVSRYIEMPVELDRQLVEYCAAVGSLYVREVRRAVERHLKYPETVTPLPKKKEKKKP